jgi:hypothetical protein
LEVLGQSRWNECEAEHIHLGFFAQPPTPRGADETTLGLHIPPPLLAAAD